MGALGAAPVSLCGTVSSSPGCESVEAVDRTSSYTLPGAMVSRALLPAPRVSAAWTLKLRSGISEAAALASAVRNAPQTELVLEPTPPGPSGERFLWRAIVPAIRTNALNSDAGARNVTATSNAIPVCDPLIQFHSFAAQRTCLPGMM